MRHYERRGGFRAEGRLGQVGAMHTAGAKT